VGDLIERLAHALDQPALGEALVCGAVLGAAAVALRATRSSAGPDDRMAVGGLVVLGAAALVMGRRGWLDVQAAAGVLLVALAWSDRLRLPRPATAAVTAVGAVLVATTGTLPLWARGVVAVVASFGAGAAATTDRRWRREAVAPTLFVLTAAGVFAAVPDTEEAAALLGAAVAAAALGWPLRLSALGRGPAAGTVALTAWVISVGSRGRPLAVVGAAACLGLLAAWPLGRELARRRHRAGHPAPVAVIVAVQAALVVVAARGAGTSFEAATAVPVAAACAVAAVTAAYLLHPRR
jgi:hypothetical protein